MLIRLKSIQIKYPNSKSYVVTDYKCCDMPLSKIIM